jgi:hypothetical protein
MPPMVKNTLETWKAVCPAGKLGLVFPNGSGNVEFHVNIIERGGRERQVHRLAALAALLCQLYSSGVMKR